MAKFDYHDLIDTGLLNLDFVACLKKVDLKTLLQIKKAFVWHVAIAWFVESLVANDSKARSIEEKVKELKLILA